MNSLKKAAEEPMTKYVARAKELRDQLAAAGLVTDDEEVAAALLAGLPADYDVIVAVLERERESCYIVCLRSGVDLFRHPEGPRLLLILAF